MKDFCVRLLNSVRNESPGIIDACDGLYALDFSVSIVSKPAHVRRKASENSTLG